MAFGDLQPRSILVLEGLGWGKQPNLRINSNNSRKHVSCLNVFALSSCILIILILFPLMFTKPSNPPNLSLDNLRSLIVTAILISGSCVGISPLLAANIPSDSVISQTNGKFVDTIDDLEVSIQSNTVHFIELNRPNYRNPNQSSEYLGDAVPVDCHFPGINDNSITISDLTGTTGSKSFTTLSTNAYGCWRFTTKVNISP
jgi:hypothetical protein